jgi:hypothetical protein
MNSFSFFGHFPSDIRSQWVSPSATLTQEMDVVNATDRRITQV